MQFTTIFTTMVLAAASTSAAPSTLQARAPEGLLNFFSSPGCLDGTQCVTDFRLQRGCQQIAAGCRASTKLTTLGSRCRVELHIDDNCQDQNNVVTLTPADAGTGPQFCRANGPEIKSVLTICTD